MPQNNLKIGIYRTVKYALIVLVTYLYVRCFDWGCVFFETAMAFLFASAFASVASLVIHFFVYFFTRPLLLPEVEEIAANGIPKDIGIVFFRPVFVKSNPEMDVHLDNLKKDIQGSFEPGAHMRWMVIDNTRDPAVREYARQRIGQLQAEFGADRVFYMHRSHKCDFFKKVGICQDAIMLLHDGWTKPRHYISQKWQPHTSALSN